MISNVANNYANALSKLPVNHSIITRELDFVWTMICKFNNSNVLNSKNSPIKYKRSVVEQLLENINISLTIRKLIQILLANNKLNIIPQIKHLYEKNVLMLENTKESILILSKQNNIDNLDDISTAMKKKFGYNFKFTTKIDEKIINGFIVKFDDLVLDLSLRGRLNKIVKQIKDL